MGSLLSVGVGMREAGISVPGQDSLALTGLYRHQRTALAPGDKKRPAA